MRYRPQPPAIEALRLRLLDAILPNVPFDGWTQATLEAGARDLGLPALEARRAFPDGPAEAIELHSHTADRAMVNALDAAGVLDMKMRERIAAGVRLRLTAAAGQKEAIRRAVGVLALPGNAARGARCLWRTVDAIWWAAGDTATDWNHYSKRGLLAGVYSSTLLFWLDDETEGSAATWEFLDRRIADVMRIPALQAKVDTAVARGLRTVRGLLPRPGRRFRSRRGFSLPF